MAAKRFFAGVMRLFRLWGVYARLDFLFMTRDPRSFLSWAGSDLLLNVAAVSGMLLLAERFGGVGVWSKHAFIFLLGYAAFVEGLLATFFGYNILHISRRIGRGQFDHLVIQPQPLALSLATEGFCPCSGGVSTLPGLALLVWAGGQLNLHFSLGWLMLFALNLFASMVIALCFQFSWGALAFWAPRAAEELNSATNQMRAQLKQFPLEGVGGWLQGALLTVLPVGFSAWVPCRALLGLSPPAALWTTPLASLAFIAVALWIFRKGLQHYGRVGSPRYSDFGHRN